LGGVLLSALKLNFLAVRYYISTLRGRLSGFRHPDALLPFRQSPMRSGHPLTGPF
jgi:hypothetical protein